MICLSLYNATTIPLGIAFEIKELESALATIVDSFVDLVFFIDIFLNLRTTYIETTSGEEIRDPKMIAKHYLKTWFFIDLLATIPFNKLVPNNVILSVLGMLKVQRVFAISMVIKNLNIKNTTKSLLKVLWLIVLLFLYLHCIACLWYYIVKDTEQWVVNCDFVFGGTQYIYEVYEGSIFRRYLRVFYVAFYIISIGEMTPRGNLELFVSATLMIFSAILVSNIFGTMAVLAVELNKKTIKF